MRQLILLCLFCTYTLADGGTGILELDSTPGGAEVFVDGKKKSTTPEQEGQKLKMELEEGDHEVEIRKAGVGSARKKVFVGDRVTQSLTLRIEPAVPETFTNRLGMKFVPVPDTLVLMCIHETRNQDYAAYAAANNGVDDHWKNPVFELPNKNYTIPEDADHPVVNVSWEDATAFCLWLGQQEGKTYRLPTDHEWSCAVGIGSQEKAGETPEEKDGKVAGYPWGASFPPPKNNVGNYRDITWVKKGESDITELGDYDDGALLTAGVMRYPANKLGIYDLGGNVWEWCQDKYSPKGNTGVLRGGSWRFNPRGRLASSSRGLDSPVYRGLNYGFRCVVVVGGSSH